METNFEIELGDKVRCRITGFTGIVISRSQWIHNCNTYGVKSTELKDGEPLDTQWFDEPVLEVVEKCCYWPHKVGYGRS